MPEDTECVDYPPIRRLQSDATTTFLRAARSGNLEKVIEYLDGNLDINTANSNGLNALHLASKDGHVEIVIELLKRGAKVDAATKKGNTALHIASLAGQSEIVNILIENGAAVNIQSQNGFTPLYMAAQENHDQVVKILLTNGANQSLATEDGFTPLAVAMQQGHDKVVSVLLENDLKGKTRLPALHIAAKKDDCKAADLLLQNDHKPDVTSKSGFTPLHIAAHYGNEEIARLLLKRGADVNYLARFNISPLHVAAKWGKNNMVKVLLEHGAVIDVKSRDGLTPLHCAARSGHEQCVTTLLESSAPISARSKSGLAPLHMASQGDHVDVVRALLYHRAPVDEVTIDYLTPLHVAAHCGHVRVAKLLLDRKADVNARALNGFTPLHIACKKNRFKVVELLVKYGASIESTTESGLTPLHVASFMGGMNIVIFLLQNEMNPDVPTVRGETPLHLAARANQTDIIRILLRNGAKVDAPARELQTPLHIASRLGNVDIVMLLLQHGAAVDTVTKDMYTALHMAAKEGQEEVVAILVDNNASICATTKNGFTPLHLAAKYGNINVAKILLQKDSKLDAQGKNNITPLLLACHYDHPNVAQLLLEKGASPHLASQNGQTPLHIAARKNQMDIASTLVEHGAKANVESKLGFTPLHLSAQKGHYDMTNLLIEHGVDPNRKAKNGLTALHLCAQEDFIRVASILVKNGANVESETETGFRPIHMAAHFGNLSMIRFLLKHNAEIDVKTKQNYTPLHQAAQQGHAHIVSALIEGNASHRARTNDGLTALNIAQKLGYISVMEVLKGLSYDDVTPDNKNWEEKYKVIAPEILQETSLMSDSDDEGGTDDFISEQPYRYLTADLMKSLRDDSLPIDVTRDDPVQRQISKEEQQEFVQSNNYCSAENFDSNDFARFLVSFLVDARGGTMKGCRHSGIRLIVPPRRATMPIRVTCRLVKPSKMTNPPPLMEGESLATRIIEMGPVGASFLGPVLIDIPHFASVRDKEREIIILRSENGETWKEHDNSADNDDTLLNTPYDAQMSSTYSGRITRMITTEFPQYFAIVTRIKQEVHVIGAEGGILISSVANQVQAVFPPGALTKKIKVGLQAHVIPAELTAKLLGNCVAVSPVITIEPRRRKFHKPISLTLPVPQAANKGMINHYGGETPTLRLLCSIAGGTSEAQWEDVTGSTPLNFMNDRVSFTTTVSARFWLMDCRNIQEVPKMATDLYKESLYVPFITNFIIYSKRMEEVEATLRILCMTDSKDEIHTLEKQEEFAEIVKSRDVETLDGKDLYIEFSGNLVPVTKSGVQLKFTFKAFRQNRLSFHVKVKDSQLDPVARMMFMREPKVAKGEPAQQPLCILNIVLPEIKFKPKYKDIEDSNIISQKMDLLRSKFDYNEEKGDQPKCTSPIEKKFIVDTLQKERTDAVDNLLVQKAQSSNLIECVDACYSAQDIKISSPALEKKTYSEKRRFWEDIARTKADSFEYNDSDLLQLAQLNCHNSDNIDLTEIRQSNQSSGVNHESLVNNLDSTVDISECTVAEKAHYFEEQIQKEITAARGSLKSQSSQESSKISGTRLSGISISSEDDKSLEMFEETERILEEKAKQEQSNRDKMAKLDIDLWEERREEKTDDIKEKLEKKINIEKKLLDKKVDIKELKDDKQRKGKGEKNLFGKKKSLREENMDQKRKSKDGKDLFEKKQHYKDVEEQKNFKIKKDISEVKNSEIEKQDTEKNVKMKEQQKHIESSIVKKLKSDIVIKEMVDKGNKKNVPDKIDLLDNEKIDKLDVKNKIAAKSDIDKESKAKVTKMQENVATKQQKLVGSQSTSPKLLTIKQKLKEDTSPKISVSKQKSKEETPPKSTLIRSKSKEESLSKSPPKKEKFKEGSLSKSPPKNDNLKDEVLGKLLPKYEKLKETIPTKNQNKNDKMKETITDKKDTKKEHNRQEISKSFKKEKSKDDVSLKSPQKNEKSKPEIVSETKSEKSKDEINKTHIPIEQKSKEELSNISETKAKPFDSSASSHEIATFKIDTHKILNQAEIIDNNQVTSAENQDKCTVKTSISLKDEINTPAFIKQTKDELHSIIHTKSVKSEDVLLSEYKSSYVNPNIKLVVNEKKTQKSFFDMSAEEQEEYIKKTTPSEKEEQEENVQIQSKTIDKNTILMMPQREKSNEEFSLKSVPQNDRDKQLSSTVRKTEKLIVEIPKSMTSQRQKSEEQFSIKPQAQTDKEKLTSVTPQKKEKSIDVIPKSMIPRRETSKEEFSLKSVAFDDKAKQKPTSPPKREKSIEEIPKSMIPRREKSKDEFSLQSVSSDDKVKQTLTSPPKREISIGEIPKSMIPKREKSKDEFLLKSVASDDKVKQTLTSPTKREKSIGEIPKSMIPRREKSKDEFSLQSVSSDDKAKQTLTSLPQKEKSIGEIPKSMIPRREKSKDEFSLQSVSSDDKAKQTLTSLPQKEKSIDVIPKSMIPRRETSKEEFSLKSVAFDDKAKQKPTSPPKREKSIEEIPKSMIPRREKSKDEFSLQSVSSDDKVKQTLTSPPKREISIGEIPKSMIPKREKSKEEFSLESVPSDDKVKQTLTSLPQKEKSIGEIPKSMIPRREKSKDEFSLQSVSSDDKAKQTLTSLPQKEKSIGEIPKSMIPKREKSKDEFSLQSVSSDDKVKQTLTSPPKREISIGEIPKSMIPRREKSKDEFLLKSVASDDKVKQTLTSPTKREKSIGEIPKSMIPKREKSKEDFSLQSISFDDKAKQTLTSLPQKEKSIGEIPKSMIPKREKSKEEFSLQSVSSDDKVKQTLTSPPKREKSIGEIPKSMIPRREKSKDEFLLKSVASDDKVKQTLTSPTKREKSIGEIPKSMIPKREKSKEDFSLQSISFDDKAKQTLTSLPQQEKSIGEIPKSMIPKREKSKEEFSLQSVSSDDKVKQTLKSPPKREISIGEIPKSMIPRREKSKDEFSLQSVSSDDKAKQTLTSLPQKEKSIGEIPKSMIPRREKSKDEFSLQSVSSDDKAKQTLTSLPQKEKSIGEIPKSMIPRRENSKDEFSLQSVSSDDKAKQTLTSLPQKEKSIGEIPKSMIPRREKSKEDFSLPSISFDDKAKQTLTSLPQKEKSIGEIPKSMIPKREKSKEEFSLQSVSSDDKVKQTLKSPPKREISIGEIPKSMIPRREKSKDEFSLQSVPSDDTAKQTFTSLPQKEKSIGEIPKSMIPRREKSKEEFSLKSVASDYKVKQTLSSPPKREKSIGEIPKSMIPIREKSKDEFLCKPLSDDAHENQMSLISPTGKKSDGEISRSMMPRREKSKDEVPMKSTIEFDTKGSSASQRKCEKTLGEIMKPNIYKREKSKEDISSKSAINVVKKSLTKREKSKEEILSKPLAKKEKSKEEFSKNVSKREKSTDDMRSKSSREHQEIKEPIKKTGTFTKSIQQIQSADEQSMKTGTKQRDLKEQIIDSSPVCSSKVGLNKEKSKEEILQISLNKRKEKDDLLRHNIKRPGILKDNDSKFTSLKRDSPSPKASNKYSTKESKIKKKIETVTVTKKKKSEEITTQEYEEHVRKNKSEEHSETFTGDEEDALKLEDTSALKKNDFVKPSNVVTSKIDHKATTLLEKKEIMSHEYDLGQEKIIAHEETEDIKKKESFTSFLMKSSSNEKIEEEENNINEISTNTTHKTLVNLTKDFEIIQASASETGMKNEHSLRSRLAEDDKKIVTMKETLHSLKDTAVGASIKLEKDLQDENTKAEDLGKIVEISTFTQDIAASCKTFDEKNDLKCKEDIISSDIENNFTSMKIKSSEGGIMEPEAFHNKFADDLTWKFANVMQKSNNNNDNANDQKDFLINKEPIVRELNKDIININDTTKNESSLIYGTSSHIIPVEEDIVLGSSSNSNKIEIANLIEYDPNVESFPSIENMKLDSKVIIEGKFISELSGARVLEILEPENDNMTKHDLADISSIKSDESQFSLNIEELPKTDNLLQGNSSNDSLNSINLGIITSPNTLSKSLDFDYSSTELNQNRANANVQESSIKRKTQRDSFEIDSPPLVSLRSKVKDLEIKSVDWMIGDEKIEVSEHLQPYQAFEKELEDYQSTLQQDSQETDTKVQDTRKFEIPRIEKTSSSSLDSPENIKPVSKSKFTVIPVSEQDIEIEKELVENELDVSCQELMDTLQREHDARTPRYSFTEEMYVKSFHFRKADEDEYILNNDKIEKLNLTDMPLETKTTSNVIEKQAFMNLNACFESVASTSKSNEPELLKLYDEPFEEALQINDKNLENIQDKKKDIEKTILLENIGNESNEDVIKIKNEPLNTDTLVEIDNIPIDKSELILDDTVEEINLCDVTEIDSEDNKKNWSYNLRKFQKQPEPSELLLKIDMVKTEPAEIQENVQLLSYKTFDPEEMKLQEFSGVSNVQKPSKTEYHREGKVDLRSKGWSEHKRMGDKREKLHMSHQEVSSYKMKKEDFQNVDMSTRYGIKVLDQVVKKEIAEVKENLEAAKQDLIEELSENSENIIQIKDSPSEFQFKLQPESIPNELPFLYKAPSLEKVSEVENLLSSSSPIAKPRRCGDITRDREESSSESSSAEKKSSDKDLNKASITVESESDKSSYKESKDIFESISSSPKAASRSGSDAEGSNKDENFCLQPPQPVPRRRQKPSHNRHRQITSDTEADISSSGESNYQSCEYETGSRPSSSDVEALQSAAQPSSTTVSEYESAMLSFDHSSSKATSQDYHTAMCSMSSRESIKSLNSLSSGQMGSIDSELSETLIASEPEMEEDEIDENLDNVLEDDTKIPNYTLEEDVDKPVGLEPEIPCMMKRSSEMIFSQVINTEQLSEKIVLDIKPIGSSAVSSKIVSNPEDFILGEIEDSDILTSNSRLTFDEKLKTGDDSSISTFEQIDTKSEMSSFEPDSLEMKHTPTSSIEDENIEDHASNSGLTLQQQLSMTSSSMSGVSLETVIEKEHMDRNSDSDSFELVDKPDLMDDFIVVEEVGREAEEFDAEGKGVSITSISQTRNKNFDREIENLVTEKKEVSKIETHSARSNVDLFDFESEESPPQASNDDQYSQSCSDDEQYNEGSKKWAEMQFQPNEARFYETEYERGPLEDIKEEEVTDFEAGSSRFGSMGSQKESIGSIGSMRGSFGSTPDNYEAFMAKRYFKPTDHDNISLSSLQEFEHLENAVAQENAKKREQQHSSSQDSSSNGSLPKRYVVSKSGHGDDVSLSSVKDFEVLEKACKEAHMIELRAREEEDLLDHESPENRYKLENLARAKVESQGSASGSFNPSTSGSDDYEKRIKEIDEIIRLAQSNVERIEKQDDTTEDISQIELTDTGDKRVPPVKIVPSETIITQESMKAINEMNVMETSIDSLELEGNDTRNYNVMCRSSDSLELKTMLDYPSMSSDSLNNFKDSKEEQDKQFSHRRRISSDSLDLPVLESQETHKEDKGKDKTGES